MKIYIDADACPKAIKAILIKAAIRTQSELILVANKALTVAPHPLIKTVVVSKGFDVADDYIADVVEAHDLVITADIPLADKVIDKEAVALNPRGMLYTKENIKQRLSLRNFKEELRSTGIHSGGPKTMSQQDIQQFANALDRYLTKRAV
jgi:hypothetical protein